MLVLLAVSLLGMIPAFAGEMLLPRESEARWAIISPPRARAPIETEGNQLLNAPVQVVTAHKKEEVLLRSPRNAQDRARMNAQTIPLQLESPSESIRYPDPAQLPIYPEKTTLTLAY